MAKIEVEEAHYFAAILALERFIEEYLSSKEITHNSGFGIIQTLKNKIGECETYLITFKDGYHKYDRIETGKFPDGKILVMFDNTGDLVTQAALTGIDMVDNPLELTK